MEEDSSGVEGDVVAVVPPSSGSDLIPDRDSDQSCVVELVSDGLRKHHHSANDGQPQGTILDKVLALSISGFAREVEPRNQDNGTDENGGYFPCSFARDVDVCSTTGDDRQDDAGCASGTNNGGNGSKSLTQGASHGTLAHRFTSTI